MRQMALSRPTVVEAPSSCGAVWASVVRLVEVAASTFSASCFPIALGAVTSEAERPQLPVASVSVPPLANPTIRPHLRQNTCPARPSALASNLPAIHPPIVRTREDP